MTPTTHFFQLDDLSRFNHSEVWTDLKSSLLFSSNESSCYILTDLKRQAAGQVICQPFVSLTCDLTLDTFSYRFRLHYSVKNLPNNDFELHLVIFEDYITNTRGGENSQFQVFFLLRLKLPSCIKVRAHGLVIYYSLELLVPLSEKPT